MTASSRIQLRCSHTQCLLTGGEKDSNRDLQVQLILLAKFRDAAPSHRKVGHAFGRGTNTDIYIALRILKWNQVYSSDLVRERSEKEYYGIRIPARVIWGS